MSLRGRPPVSPQPCAHLRPGSEPPSPPSGRLCVLCIVRHVLCASFIGLAPVPVGTVRFTVSSGPTPCGGRWADQLGSWDRRGRAGRHPRGPVKGARRGRTPRMSPDGGVGGMVRASFRWNLGPFDKGGGTGRSSELAARTEPVCRAGSSRASCRDQPWGVL